MIPQLIGGQEWVIIIIVALLLFGGSRVAGLGKGIGRSIREFREEVKTSDSEKTEKQIDNGDSSESSKRDDG